MPSRRRRLPLLAAAAAALCALAQPAAAPAATPNLWSTINICDTARYPDHVGIRARMPGDGTSKKMYMKFLTQYWDSERDRWRPATNSGWIKAGSALYTYQERGYTFGFEPPDPGQKFLFRGLVKFEWRKNGSVVKKTHRYTTSGHPAKGADPKNYSARRCTMRGPEPVVDAN